MRALDVVGLTMPWRSIYVAASHEHSRSLREHEQIHIQQIDRDGPIRFSLLYLYYQVRYGYETNPYEVEAYAFAPIIDETNTQETDH